MNLNSRFRNSVCAFANAVLRVLYVFSAIADSKAVVAECDAAVSVSDFFVFHGLFAGIHLRFSVLPCVKRRECGGFHRFMCDLWRLHGSKHCYYGEKCRNGCGFGCLRGWFRRLRMWNGGFGVVFRGFSFAEMVVAECDAAVSVLIFFVFHGLFAGIYLRLRGFGVGNGGSGVGNGGF